MTVCRKCERKKYDAVRSRRASGDAYKKRRLLRILTGMFVSAEQTDVIPVLGAIHRRCFKLLSS